MEEKSRFLSRKTALEISSSRWRPTRGACRAQNSLSNCSNFSRPELAAAMLYGRLVSPYLSTFSFRLPRFLTGTALLEEWSTVDEGMRRQMIICRVTGNRSMVIARMQRRQNMRKRLESSVTICWYHKLLPCFRKAVSFRAYSV